VAVRRDARDPPREARPRRRSARRVLVRRLLPLLVAALVLYGVAPAVLEVFGAYDRLKDVDAWWWVAVLVTSAAGIGCMCALQRLALNRAPWPAVLSSELAGAAFSKVVPGGSAAASALQARMLAQAGFAPAAIGTGLTAGALLLLGALAGLPLLALPALLFGKRIPGGLLEVAAVGLAVFAILCAVGTALLVNHRVVLVFARVIALAGRALRRESDERRLRERLLEERTRLRRSLGRSWPQAVASASGRWIFDFLCLYAALLAVDARPPLYVALLAYSGAQLLGQIPLTPGGLGIVEAGLTGTLALAGVPAAPAALATLTYRLASYWLPLPAGLAAWLWHRRRYGPRSA